MLRFHCLAKRLGGVSLFLLTALAATTMAGVAAQGARDTSFSCDDSRNGRRETFCEIREETLTGVSTLDVDATPNGGIRVRGWDRGDVQVRSRVTAYADTEAEARSLAAGVSISTSGGRIRADGPASGRDEHWSVSFELLVPRNGSVTLDTRNGGISIADFRGTARFEARNGGVTLSNVGGDIRGETVNGGISIELDGDRWNGAGLDVETRNGGVRMLVPANYSARLETGTVNGGFRVDFPITVQGRLPAGRNRTLNTTLGSGGPTIRAVTTNGGVTIARR
jgi:hypothetical protein